jgi:predicted site-specific integrase-resolvase
MSETGIEEVKLLTYEDVARIFDVPKGTVKYWKHQNKLVPLRGMGKRVRFHPDYIQELLDRGRDGDEVLQYGR